MSGGKAVQHRPPGRGITRPGRRVAPKVGETPADAAQPSSA